MRARVKANSPIASVRACVGRGFTRDSWTELPDSFLEEVRVNPLLEVEQVLSVVPDEFSELEEPVEQAEAIPHGRNVVLAGNAMTVKRAISSMRDIENLKRMKQDESSGKARKGVLDAIEDRLTEVEDVQ